MLDHPTEPDCSVRLLMSDNRANLGEQVSHGNACSGVSMTAVPMAARGCPHWLSHLLRRSQSAATSFFTLSLLCIVSPGLLAQDTSEPEVAPHNTPLESRLISDSELEEYLEELAAMLPMATQERDPFGAFQDPDAVPKAPPMVMPDMPTMPEFTTPFEDVIRMISVTTVMPADKKFLMGTRSFGVNDVVTFNYRGQPIRARVEEVSSREIRFRNVETNDVATRTLEILPAGMNASGGGRQAIPGLIPTGPDVPIDLD